jgi:hypothetical protein
MPVSKSAIPALDSYTPNHVNDISSSSEGRIICEPWAKGDKPTFDMEGHVLLTPAVAAAHRLILLVWVGDRTGLADGAEAPILPVANALAWSCSSCVWSLAISSRATASCA